MRSFLSVVAVATALVGLAWAAQARTCYTSCNTYGGYTNCTQNCY